MHLELRYVTRFLYPSPVWDSHNALRAKPASDEHQQLGSYVVRITPHARVFTYVDNWGTEVNTFSIGDEHTELIVDARAAVDTALRPIPPKDIHSGLVADAGFREDHWTYLRPSSHVEWTEEIAETARLIVGDSTDVTERIRRVAGFVADRLEYTPGATVVGTKVSELWAMRQGVCQDFAHLSIGLLRSIGIPARYVSGYLYAADPASADFADTGEIVVQTHAWVEAAIPGWGWWAIDPTNETVVGERHVTIGRGRDYEDVMPLRGVYHGDAEATLAVEVTMSQSVVTERIPALSIDQ